MTAGLDISGESRSGGGSIFTGDLQASGPGTPVVRGPSDPDGEGLSVRAAPSAARVDHAIPAYCGPLVD